MKYVVRYARHAKKDLDSLSEQDSKRIVAKLRIYSSDGSPMKFAKSLSGSWKGLFRFRIGVYRVIFKKDAKGRITILTILRVKHRKEVYKII